MSRAARRVGGVETWSGAVELEGECVIAAGAVLRLAPGCRVAAPAGSPPPRLVVEGMLVVEGTPRRPAALKASVAAAGGWVLLSNCRLEGRGGEGLHLYGDGHRLDGVALSGFEAGLFLRDGAVEARRLAVSDCARAITVAAGGRLRLEDARVSGCEEGLALRGGEAVARGLTVHGGRSPVAVGAGSKLAWEGGAFTAGAAANPLILAQGELVARGAPGRPLTLDAPIAAAGGRVELSHCRLNGRGGEGLNLYGAGHRLEDVRLTGFETGLTLRDGEASARGLAIEGGTSPLLLGPGGKLDWQGGGFSARGSARPLILVQGALSARALALDASLASHGGRVELSECRLDGWGGEGVTLTGSGHRLESVTLAGFERALTVRAGAARALGLTISGAASVVEVGEGGSLDWEGGGVAASGAERARVDVKGELTGSGSPERPLRLDAALAFAGGSARLSRFLFVGADGAEVELDAFAVARCGAGAASARDGRLAWDPGGAPAERPVVCVEGEFTARGAGRPFALGASLSAVGGRVELADCRLEGRGGEGLTLRGGGHRLERVALEGFDCGLSLRGGEALARDLTFVRCETAASVGEDGLLLWDGGGARDGGTGALVAGGRAFLRGLDFRGLRRGVRVEGGAAAVDGLDCRGLSGAAVELTSPGFAVLRGVRAPGGEALAASAGHVHLAGPVAGRVGVFPPAELCVAPSAVARAPLAPPRAFVLATGGRPAWGAAYRAAAAAAVRLFAAWARLQPRVAGAWAHRSWVSGGWEPGASDIDLALSVRELSSPGAKRWLGRTQAIHAGARRLFPALGELLIAEEAEWRESAASGLARPGEWRSQARVLAGRLPGVREPAPAAARAGARLEAAMAYTRLMDVCFHPERAEELARRDAAKALVDFLRYRSDAGEAGRALSREEHRASLASSSPEWAERLRELDVPGRAHRTACALAAAAARRWPGPGPESRPPLRAARSAAERPSELGRLLDGVEDARRDFGGAVSAAVFDTLHRSFLVVEPDFPEEAFAEGLAAWSRRAAARGERTPLPIVLTPPGWEVWRGTAYQDFPSAAARWPRPGDAVLEAAGTGFPGERRLFWGEHLSPAPSADEASAALAQGRAQFRAVRRFLVREARSSRAAAHHLLSRAACLALRERGLPAPDFDLDAALSGLESFAPRAAARLERAASGDWTGFDAAIEELLPPSDAPPS